MPKRKSGYGSCYSLVVPCKWEVGRKVVLLKGGLFEELNKERG